MANLGLLSFTSTSSNHRSCRKPEVTKGVVVAKISGTFTTRCLGDAEAFPYDSQKCDFVFQSDLPTYLLLLTKMMNVTEADMQSDFKGNSEWDMELFSLLTKEPTETSAIENLGMKSAEVHVTFTVKRKPFYYLVLLVLPILMSTILIIIIPLIPIHSGERLGFTTNLFLALVLFLLLVDNMLPKSSFSSLTISMTISVVLVLLNIFETIIVIYVDEYLNNAAAAAATTQVFPMSPTPPESPEPVGRLEAPEDDATASRSESRASKEDAMKKMHRMMKRINNLVPRPHNPRLLMHRVDRIFAVLNFLVVVCANLYIISKLIPK